MQSLTGVLIRAERGRESGQESSRRQEVGAQVTRYDGWRGRGTEVGEAGSFLSVCLLAGAAATVLLAVCLLAADWA